LIYQTYSAFIVKNVRQSICYIFFTAELAYIIFSTIRYNKGYNYVHYNNYVHYKDITM